MAAIILDDCEKEIHLENKYIEMIRRLVPIVDDMTEKGIRYCDIWKDLKQITGGK